MKLWLLRHAQPLVPDGVCYGATDVTADPQATQQAAIAAAALLPSGLAVRTSPLRRCRELAQALQVLRADLAALEDARLAEMDFGRWEGQPWSAIAPSDFAAWMADFPGYRCGGGECVSRLMARVDAALDETRRGGRDALWIAHGGVVRAVRLLVAGKRLPARADEWPREPLDFGQAACIELPWRPGP
ncbi:MAG TPA: histidine phosphatase family protein [Ramlibacter sp.]|uniref:histidine phosphatase family protein n=1 Tax=Ramlibacter sp. TaxID=1917967 RepID=UPI002ED38928